MRVDVGGLSVSYELAGSGPVVALAHGFVGDGISTWGSQIESMSDEFTVVAWDAPGAGRSDDPPEGFGMDDYADCFAAFIHEVGFESAHLVGLSFGGSLVLATFNRHRGIASSLALVSGYAGWVGSLGLEDARKRLARSLELSELPADDFVASMMPSMFSPAASEKVVAEFVESVRAFRPVGFRAMARASFEDQSHVLEQVDVPALLLYSGHDQRAPVAVGEALHAVLRDSELVVLPAPGHASTVEAPNEVTAALRRFLHSLA